MGDTKNMNFSVNKKELENIAKSMIKIVPTSNNMKEIEGFLIECDEDTGELTLTVTNLEAAIQRKIKASVGESGSFVMNAQTLLGIATFYDNLSA